MHLPSQRLCDLGLTLPPVSAPVAAYVPAVRTGNHVYTSGQLPFIGGELPQTGKVGDAVTLDEAVAHARVATLNALAAAAELAGGLDNITRILKITVFVASSQFFVEQPKVANGASLLLGDVFAEAGQHARSAVGVTALPLDAPVEIELLVEVA